VTGIALGSSHTKILGMVGMLAGICFLSFIVGGYYIEPVSVLGILLSKIIHVRQFWTSETEMVVMKIRLPRIAAALLVGAALSTSGAAYQGLFRNPMVSPGILGVAAGAGFGAALGMLFSFDIAGVQITAFCFGLLAVTITYLISAWMGKSGDSLLVMVLAGIIISTLFSSFLSLIKYVADPNSTLPAITYWLMGSLASVRMSDVYGALLPILAGIVILILLRWQLNVMTFGEEEAKALGIYTGKLRLLVILCATMMTAASVSISGEIGLVGLIVPHFARLLFGPNYKTLMPVSALMGAMFLLIVDDFARTICTAEIPLGIITSIIGAPFFLYLLINTRRGWI